MSSSRPISGHDPGDPGDSGDPTGTDDVVSSGSTPERGAAWGAAWAAARWPPGWTVRRREVTGSTNDDLAAEAVAGRAAPRTAFVAGHQTAGRGRMDRRWDAPAGANLLVSLLLEGAGSPHHLVQRVGVALVDAVDELAGGRTRDLGLKWPNDVVVGNRKLAGVLAQGSRRPGGDPMVVVGCGVNVGWAPDGAVSVDDIAGGPIAPAALLAALLARFDSLAADPSTGHGVRYRARLLTLGRVVRVELPGGQHVEGTATDVGDDGRLCVVTADGSRRWFDVGDIVHLRADHT